MDIIDNLAQANIKHDSVVTIGAFDGVHLGHQALIKGVVDRARETGRLAAVVTFHPHPSVVLAPQRPFHYLTTPGEKIALLESLGVDVMVLVQFTREVAAMSAHDFMDLLVGGLRLRELWVGPDFALGRNREGDIGRLRELGQEMGYEVYVVQPVDNGQGIISSSRIRELLAQGAVAEAAGLLGRYPSLSGEVVGGARRGRKLGFPTANLEVRAERAVPANGVYAVFALLGSERYAGVANVGVRPSFDNGERTVETHILDFDQDLYGCDLVVEFVARLRDEQRFSDISELVAQIDRDSRLARQILRDSGFPVSQGPSGCRYRYVEVEHTADRALRVWGQTLPDLFVAAARGMSGLMAELSNLAAIHWRQVRLEAFDRESLLVDWLNELLYLVETEGLLFVEFDIELLTDTTLVARAGGACLPATREQVKAATYHNLSLVHDDTGWSTTITFDV